MKDEITMIENEISNYEVDKSVVAVIVGADYTFSYRKLCIASLHMQINGA